MKQVGNVTIKQLVAFRELAQVGIFGAAAARLGIGQPGLSRSLKQLESGLGVELMRRHSKGAVLTEKGTILKGLVDPFLHALGGLPDADVRTSIEQKIVVGIPATISALVTPEIMKSALERGISKDVTVFEDSSLGLEHALEAGIVDLALLYDPAVTPDLTRRAILEEDMVVIASPFYKWPNDQPSVPVKALKNIPMVFLKPDQNDRRRLAEAERQHGIRLDALVEVSSPSTVKTLVNQGVGLSVASALGVSREIAVGSLQCRPLGAPAWHTRLWVSTRAGGLQSTLMQSLVETVVECVTRCADNHPGVTLLHRADAVLAG